MTDHGSTTLLLLLLLTMGAVGALKCHAGVDGLRAGSVECERRQCMNSTSSLSSVYGCDFSQVCELFELHNGCVVDGDAMVCCCSHSDHCNVRQAASLELVSF